MNKSESNPLISIYTSDLQSNKNIQDGEINEDEEYLLDPQYKKADFSKLVINKISRINSEESLEGMKFDSQKDKPSWLKVLKLHTKKKK